MDQQDEYNLSYMELQIVIRFIIGLGLDNLLSHQELNGK